MVFGAAQSGGPIPGEITGTQVKEGEGTAIQGKIIVINSIASDFSVPRCFVWVIAKLTCLGHLD